MGHRIVLAAIACAGLTVALTACSYTTQATSGREYLRSYAQDAGPKAAPMSKALVEAASVEPLLRFPARIGIARLGPGGLVGIPGEEAAAWQKVAESLGPRFGTFVPVSPLIAEMVAGGSAFRPSAREAVEKIRLAAARQHLDAVVIYESEGTADSRDNPLSIAEWTLIGAFILPSQDVKARGVAQAMLVDVRNAYPYGTAQAEADDETSTARFSQRSSERDLAEVVRLNAVKNLAPEVEKMIRDLRTDLAEARERRGRR